ncbi:Uncharacterized conserved protein, DUF885 familyt [Microbulbifer donghaiensis]|uniref:Uncharacterized conserved protein, DUF885 familyt n=1 Tax=Microbulbifer donghaiensis TaxID=494016 RepID=A0A1M5G2P5_9GAMM|nr:DUF885 domain-containing protein [Microbulbifer donghaiensis]SHF97692.1 Uncharacterized conserved protein, DUF885 familyt [Microbulbifer donghaiensis]
MIKRIAKWTGGILLAGMLAVSAFAINAIYFKPWSINIFFERAFIKLGTTSPEILSQLRLFEQFGIDGHNAHLDDVSEAEGERQLQMIKDELAVLRRYDRTGLEGQQAVSFDVLEYFLNNMVEGERWQYHNYPLNQMSGEQNELPEFLAEIHQITNVKEADYYLSRLSEVDRKFGQVLDGLKIREERNIIPPRFVIDSVLGEMRGFIGVPVTENILYTSLVERLDKIEELPADDRERILTNGASLIQTDVYPAYRDLIAYYETLQPKAQGNNGVWSLPDGDDFYAYQVRSNTTSNMTPEQLHNTGLAEVARIEGEMNLIFASLGQDSGTIGERFALLNEQPQFLYENSAAGREQIITDYQQIIDEIDTGLTAYFDVKPAMGVEVRRVPEFKEQGSAGAYYNPPAMDGSRPGIFYANLREVSETKKFGMRTLAYHEAVPGHHFQLAIAQELQGVPTFRKLGLFTAYAEGWALYAERVAKEAGFQEDPYDDLGRLQAEMFRAVRLVVDTGMHYKRWSREEAIAYMVEKTGMAESEVTTEIERYLVWPGQALAYKAGMMKILELREKARTELGSEFDIRQFHNVVLTNGAMPLAVLENQVNHWIDDQRG